MTSACEVIRNVQRHVMTKILLDPERDLLHIGSRERQIGRKTRRQDRQRKSSRKKILVHKQRVRIVRIEALLAGDVIDTRRTRTQAVAISQRSLKRVRRIQ